MQNSEIKILDVPVEEVESRLLSLGAVKVFDGNRTITYFKDANDSIEPFLKLTEEDKLKLTSQSKEGKEIKLFVSRKEECVSLLKTLGYDSVSEVSARRVSFELNGIDCDIDVFPNIPPFMEIDMDESNENMEDFLSRLNLEKNTRGVMSTPDILKKYGFDYFEIYKINS